MPLAKTREIYRKARKGGYGIGGFCAENLDMIQAIIGAAEQTRSPVVVMLWEEDIRSMGVGYLEAAARYVAERSTVPVGLMVDHAASLAFCLTCIINGHTGVMIDGSHLPLSENIALTRRVCEVAHLLDVLVEGELGTIRRTFESRGPYSEQTVYTDPQEVAEFVAQSGADALAVSIGTESGINEHTPSLDIERLRRIRAASDAYLVLHGGSGTPLSMVSRLVQEGVTAMRFASAIRLTYLNTVARQREALGHNYPDTRLIFGPARESAKAMVAEYMVSLGCAGQADRW